MTLDKLNNIGYNDAEAPVATEDDLNLMGSLADLREITYETGNFDVHGYWERGRNYYYLSDAVKASFIAWARSGRKTEHAIMHAGSLLITFSADGHYYLNYTRWASENDVAELMATLDKIADAILA